MEPVTKEEVEGILKLIQKDKIPRPNGWMVELFPHFFKFLGEDILEVVEESRSTGSIYQPFNSTFLALIPKNEHLVSFDDF